MFAATSPARSSEISRVEARPLSEWSVEEKAGQLLMVGFRSVEQVKRIRPSGVILFAWNMPSVEKTKKLTVELELLAKRDLRDGLFIATDHEGGEVLRLRKGLTGFPDAAAVGATGDEFTAFRVGKAMGHELAALGINMNLAPVLDLGNARSFLRNRVWGNTGGDVARLTTAYIRGLQSARVLAVAKHFPGHGGSAEDSHFGLPRVTKPFEDLWRQDLEPFRQAVKEGVQAVMTAHVEVPAIDRGPASLSPKFVTGILRQTLGFEGLVLTDDVEMGGATGVRGTPAEELALRALRAGTDIVMVVWSEDKQRKIRDRIVQAVRDGEVTSQWLDEKVERILKAKASYLAAVGSEERNPYWQENLRRSENLKLAAEVSRRGVVWMAGSQSELIGAFSKAWERPWQVVLPEGRTTRYWQETRRTDEVFSYRRNPTSVALESLRRTLRDAKKSGEPLLVVTGPRSSAAEASFRVIREELGRSSLSAETSAPVLWVHQGAKPVEFRRDPASLRIGIVGLHSASIASLMALSEFLRGETLQTMSR